MDTETVKKELINWIETLEDNALIKNLQAVKHNRRESSSDWWDELPQAARESINRAEEDIKAGRTTPHEKVRKTYDKWLK